MKLLNGNRILVIGRAGIDFYPEPVGSSIEQGELFRPVLGGSSGNIAAGLARLGSKVTMLTKVSDDALGRRVEAELANYGVSARYVSRIGGDKRVSLAFAENRVEGHQVVLYRNEAADFFFDKEDVNSVDFSEFDALILTGTALAREPSRAATLYAMDKAKEAGLTTIIDLDYRAPTWTSEQEAATIYLEASEKADIVIGNDVEFDVMSPHNEGQSLAQKLGANKLVIYKMGEKGAIAYNHGESSEYGIFKVEALKPVGAGDAFMSGFISKLVEHASLEEAMNNGAAAAAIVVSRPGCAPAMPNPSELSEFLLNRS